MDSETSGSAEGKKKMVQGKDCWNTCDYPSECRWGKRFGIHTPVATEFPTIDVRPPPPPPPPPMTFEGILKPENCKEMKKEKKADRTDFWGALVASATRRKSIPPSSPLASVVEEPEPASPSRDNDGDVNMTTIDPALLALSAPSAPSLPSVTATLTTSPVVTLKEIIRKSSKRVGKASKPSETREPTKLDPMLTAPAPAAVVDDFEYGNKSFEDAAIELAPLERVKSRDSGYHSTPESS